MAEYTNNSILLETLQGLFIKLNPSIVLKFSADGHKLIASNITEKDINRIYFLTNDARNNSILKLEKVEVFLDGDFNASPVYGLYDILAHKIILENSIAYYNGIRVFQPFSNGFDTGVDTVNILVDKLSALTRLSPNTSDKIKTYRMEFTNDNTDAVLH